MTTTHRSFAFALALVANTAGASIALAHEPAKKPEAMPHAMTGMHHDMTGMSEGSKQLHQAMMSGMKMPMAMTGNVDTDFATMMTMHHRQAVQMADVLLKYGKQPELRALAQKMKASQLDEIQAMAPYVAPAKK